MLGTDQSLLCITTMHFIPTRQAGRARLAAFLQRAGSTYAKTRNFDDGPASDTEQTNVSHLSPWLHSGLLSESEVIASVLARHSPRAAESFVSEVFWRVYFKGYLEQRPTIWRAYTEERDAALARLDSNAGLAKAYTEAVEGHTGITAFDIWARELVEHGYLHNHARMWFASIWIFTLRLDWQLGADFFLTHLVDGDAASNTLSWRWVAGLHTKGKTYLARPSNIESYTANRDGGPLIAQGLAEEAPALEEAQEHDRQPLDLPDAPPTGAFDEPFALLLHDESASHVPLDVPCAPALIIGAARPEARSPGQIGTLTRDFARDAVQSGLEDATEQFGCPTRIWSTGDDLAAILEQAGLERLALPYLPTGWTRDALWPQIAPLAQSGRTTTLISPLSRSTWPLARAGFFKVKKAIPDLLDEHALVALDEHEHVAGGRDRGS